MGGDVWQLAACKSEPSVAELPPWICNRRQLKRKLLPRACETRCESNALQHEPRKSTGHGAGLSQPAASIPQVGSSHSPTVVAGSRKRSVSRDAGKPCSAPEAMSQQFMGSCAAAV